MLILSKKIHSAESFTFKSSQCFYKTLVNMGHGGQTEAAVQSSREEIWAQHGASWQWAKRRISLAWLLTTPQIHTALFGVGGWNLLTYYHSVIYTRILLFNTCDQQQIGQKSSKMSRLAGLNERGNNFISIKTLMTIFKHKNVLLLITMKHQLREIQ